MKKGFCIVLSLALVLSLAACGPSASPSPDSESAAVEKASTAEELNSLIDQYEKEEDYSSALLAAEKLTRLDPSDDDAYIKKAELRISALRAENESLNKMLEEDIGGVGDRAAYKERVSKLYEEAGLKLSMPFVPDYVSKDEINVSGNSCGNLAGAVWTADFSACWNGVFAAQGDWVYYSEFGENFALYKVRGGGAEKQKLCDDGASNLNVAGDWIYFVNLSDNNAPYKIRTDGSEKQKLAEDGASCLCITHEMIYFAGLNEGGAVYRMKTDGSGREPMGFSAQTLFADGLWLYFSTGDEKTVERVSLDGVTRQVLLDGGWRGLFCPYEECFYYLTLDSEGFAVMKMNPDGGEKSELWRSGAKVNFFSFSAGRLLVAVRSPENVSSILAFDLDTMEQILELDNVPTQGIFADGTDNVFFMNAAENYALYRIDWQRGAAVKM
ncbi:hypothetical protein SDC9_54762 [bioreactor metagenome]|uniref:Prolow-density lipoprotein receptor-related protein 1-like beta-propeller domain-containing protein n=1 Tax=bioreactor metagenome TaxID=1076179 RepID=A0A644WX22_9ZZZZ